MTNHYGETQCSKIDLPDFSTSKEYADHIARRLEKFWKERGFMGVRVWNDEKLLSVNTHLRTYYLTRSNIGTNGYPPKVAV